MYEPQGECVCEYVYCNCLSYIYVNMCRYLSRWIPGDEIVGSGGPPFLFPTSSRNQLGGVDGVNVGTSTSNIGFNNSSVQLSGMFASYVV